MRQATFVTRRQEGWQRLEAVLTRADRIGVAGLPPGELYDLGMLYRSATTDLAASLTRGYDPELSAYLNRLVARAHAVVYASTASSGWSRVRRFYTHGFPSEVRRSFGVIAACIAITVATAVVAYVLVSAKATNAYAVLGDVPEIKKSLHDSNFAFDRYYAARESAAIITNNVRVAAVAFAGGMTLGIMTVWIIVENGLMVGGLGALFSAHGYGLDFWATIAPHGVIELTAIQIAGGAGLLLAQGVIAPGRLRRIDAMKRNARRAATLMIGVASMLCVAGTIEGFVTPQRTPIAFRIAVGVVTALALLAYFGFTGRRDATPALEASAAGVRSGRGL